MSDNTSRNLESHWKSKLQKGSILLLRSILPVIIRKNLARVYHTRRMRRLPDRIYMERELIPAIARHRGKILFVGCEYYTKHYPALFEMDGGECSTIDINPSVARWGAPSRHVISAFQDARNHWPAASFDYIVLSGVFGHGINGEEDQNEALRVCSFLLKSGGWLILGWNKDKLNEVNPPALSVLQREYRPASLEGLEQRKTFPESTHVYLSYVRID